MIFRIFIILDHFRRRDATQTGHANISYDDVSFVVTIESILALVLLLNSFISGVAKAFDKPQ